MYVVFLQCRDENCLWRYLSVWLLVCVIRGVVPQSDIVSAALYLWTLFPLQDFGPAWEYPALVDGFLTFPSLSTDARYLGQFICNALRA